MTSFLLKMFIYKKNYPEQKLRTALGTFGGAVGIVVNILLAAGKSIAGLLFGSIALVADALNNVTDAASGIITLFGFKLSAKNPDEDHPYGHGRMEYISGMIMAFIVLMLGLSLLKSSVEQVFRPEALTFSYVSIGVMAAGILLKLWLSVFYKKMQKITDSATFGAASADSRNDVISTAAVLIGNIIFKLTGLNLDGYIGVLVSVFVLISGVGLIKETLDPLLGRPPEKELVEKIHTKALSYPEIIGIHDLIVHDYGPGRMFICFHAEVDAATNVLVSHDIIDNVERDFKSDLGLETVIHLDPIVTDDPIINDLKAYLQTVIADIDPDLTLHDFRGVIGPTHTNLIFDVVLPVGKENLEKTILSTVNARLSCDHPRCFAVITFDKNYIGVV